MIIIKTPNVIISNLKLTNLGRNESLVKRFSYLKGQWPKYPSSTFLNFGNLKICSLQFPIFPGQNVGWRILGGEVHTF